MKIAFDVQLFLKGEKTGIAWSADNVIANLQKESKNEYYLNCFTHKSKHRNLLSLKNYIDKGAKLNDCKWFDDSIYKAITAFVAIPYSWFFGNKADITQFFNFIIPPGVKGKKVTIIHDMAFKALPETVRLKTKLWLSLALKKTCKRADKIITVSEFSKKEIIKYLNIPDEKIVVMPNGVNVSLYHSNYSVAEIEDTKKKYNILSNYILYLGTLEPRKNIIRLIKAYKILVSKNPAAPVLVLAGRKGWMYDEIYSKVKEEKMEKRIIFIGYVEACDCPKLLCGADIFTFPSIYEGFGMPILEAMACGTPVISSNLSSLPEVAGDAAVLVDPYSEEEIFEGIENLLENQSLRDKLIIAGYERVKQFTWDNAANILLNVYEGLMT